MSMLNLTFRDYWYVLAPNVFRLGHNETLVAGVLGDATNQAFKVSILRRWFCMYKIVYDADCAYLY